MKKRFLVLTLLFVAFKLSFSQDLFLGNKLWYSAYIYKKINKKIYTDAYILNGYNVNNHSFSFLQIDFAINYKFDKKQTVYVGYSPSIYQWIPSYSIKYGSSISPLGTVYFSRLFTGYKYRVKLFKGLRLKNDLGAQFYFPRLEKYQFRFTYKAKFYWYDKNWPLKISPFTQLSLYYYLNGIPAIYYNDNGEFAGYKSPNGLHRYRLKLGFSIKPFKQYKKISLVMYYAIQREFNISGLGNDLNVTKPGSANDIVYPFTPQTSKVRYPFNGFDILGFQINIIL